MTDSLHGRPIQQNVLSLPTNKTGAPTASSQTIDGSSICQIPVDQCPKTEFLADHSKSLSSDSATLMSSLANASPRSVDKMAVTQPVAPLNNVAPSPSPTQPPGENRQGTADSHLRSFPPALSVTPADNQADVRSADHSGALHVDGERGHLIDDGPQQQALRPIDGPREGERDAITDWQEACSVFIDHMKQCDMAEIRSISRALGEVLQYIPSFDKSRLPSPLERRIRNRFEAQFKAQFERGGRLCRSDITGEADKILRRTGNAYARRLRSAVTQVSMGRIAKDEYADVLTFLMHEACKPRDSKRSDDVFFAEKIVNLRDMSKQERKTHIDSIIAATARFEATPLNIIERLESIPVGRIAHKLVNYGGRPIVAIRIGGLRAPFYQSLGENPKEGVVAGKWYPFFGISEDGWINKMDVGKRNLGNYYKSFKLSELARALDADFGDIRDVDDVAELPQDTEEAVTFLNRDFRLLIPGDTKKVDEKQIRRNFEANCEILDFLELREPEARRLAATKIANRDWARRKEEGAQDDQREAYVKRKIEACLTWGDPVHEESPVPKN